LQSCLREQGPLFRGENHVGELRAELLAALQVLDFRATLPFEGFDELPFQRFDDFSNGPERFLLVEGDVCAGVVENDSPERSISAEAVAGEEYLISGVRSLTPIQKTSGLT
jgi:hypothetical protein